MLPELDLQQLKMFYTLARTGSYTETARRLHRTQSAVSHAIRKLERSVGSKLVSRSGRKFELSEEGEHIFQACREAFNALDSATENITRNQGRDLGLIRLGATVEFGCSVLMKHMGPFLDSHPEVEMEFRMTHDLLGQLLGGDLDLIIDCDEHRLPELEQIPLFRESYTVACSPDFLEKHKLETIGDLSACPVLALDRGGQWWHRFLFSLPSMGRPTLGRLIVINHIRAMIIAAKSSIGVALLPSYSIIQELEQGSLIPLFPEIRLLEDRFSIYREKRKTPLERQDLLIEYLLGIQPAEFGSR
jgi:DNA-binding transcriptional LysR family regulator